MSRRLRAVVLPLALAAVAAPSAPAAARDRDEDVDADEDPDADADEDVDADEDSDVDADEDADADEDPDADADEDPDAEGDEDDAPRGPAPMPRAARAPLAMDRHDDRTRLGVQLDIGHFTNESVSGDSAHFEVYGHKADRRGVSYYGTVALSKGFGDSSDSVALSNLEGGAYLFKRWSEFDVTLRVGATLPTAPTGDGARSSALGAFGRITDFARAWPALWLRPSMSLASRGPSFFRVDLGVDLGIDKEDDADGNRGKRALVRANVGGGKREGDFLVLAELCTLYNGEELGSSELLVQPVVGVRYLGWGLNPGLSLSAIFAEKFDPTDVIVLGLSGSYLF